jgi:L-seryl-tRNA(Ser) seleniumtransferase
MKNEIVVQRGHRNAYDHAIRAAGVTFVEVGYLGYPGAGGTFGWQIDEAINERTAAVACPIMETPGTLPLPEVAKIAHARGVPVIVDAAAQLPPRANLKRFIAEGADLVAFSGGKAIMGPQSSGILAGRADLIASVALQHQDMDVRSATWNKRGLIEDRSVAGIPHQGFGRSMKVGREEIVGLVTALKIFAAGDDQRDAAEWTLRLDPIEQALIDLPYVQMKRVEKNLIPQLVIEINEPAAGITAYEVSRQLLEGEPAVAVGESRAEFGALNVVSRGMTADEAEMVAGRFKQILGRV